MEIFTIGFTKRNAIEFFGALSDAGVRRLLDIRVNNTSQLAGFTKRDDLKFFLRRLCDISYQHELALAPDASLLAAYRKREMAWPEYEQAFAALMTERRVQERFRREDFLVPTALLCSEATTDRCHRRLVVEHFRRYWPEVMPRHL